MKIFNLSAFKDYGSFFEVNRNFFWEHGEFLAFAVGNIITEKQNKRNNKTYSEYWFNSN